MLHTPRGSESEEREVLFVYAVIVTGGKQYKVAEGDIIVEKLDVEVESEITFDEVLGRRSETLKSARQSTEPS